MNAGAFGPWDVEKAIVAGLSMGGYVALAFWRRHQARVVGLALVDTRAEPDTPIGKANRDVTAGRVREAGPLTLVDEMMPKLLAPRNLADEIITAPLRKMILSQPIAGLTGALQDGNGDIRPCPRVAVDRPPASIPLEATIMPGEIWSTRVRSSRRRTGWIESV